MKTHTFEIGRAVRGQRAGARQPARARRERREATHAAARSYPELVERPRGTVEAVDERGVVVRNDAILWFEPGPSGLVELRDVDNERGGKETRKYFGKLYVTVDNSGQLAVVNAVPEDKLLAGLVPAEMSASSPPEALKAQAVAARNELLAKIGTRHLTDPYRLCSTQHCQVYAGAGREDARATAAVPATRGELLVRDSGGGLVDAVYSASCGGHGENNEHVWGGAADASLRGRLDADAAGGGAAAQVRDASARPSCARGWPSARRRTARGARAPKRRRSTSAGQKAIDLAALEARAAVGKLRELTVARARRLRSRHAAARRRRRRRARVEAASSRSAARSATSRAPMFVLDVARDAGGHVTSLTATGGGHGHGVGMCQVGAVGMAAAGRRYDEILRQLLPRARTCANCIDIDASRDMVAHKIARDAPSGGKGGSYGTSAGSREVVQRRQGLRLHRARGWSGRVRALQRDRG